MPTRKGKTQYKSAVWVHDKDQENVVNTKIKEVESNLGLKVRKILMTTDIRRKGESAFRGKKNIP